LFKVQCLRFNVLSLEFPSAKIIFLKGLKTKNFPKEVLSYIL